MKNTKEVLSRLNPKIDSGIIKFLVGMINEDSRINSFQEEQLIVMIGACDELSNKITRIKDSYRGEENVPPVVAETFLTILAVATWLNTCH